MNVFIILVILFLTIMSTAGYRRIVVVFASTIAAYDAYLVLGLTMYGVYASMAPRQ